MIALEPNESLFSDPAGYFGRLRERHGPVVHVSLPDGSAAWLVLGVEEAKAALVNDSVSVNRASLGNVASAAVSSHSPFNRKIDSHLLNLDGPDHARLRKLVAPRFRSMELLALEPLIVSLAETLLSRAGLNAEFDVVGDFAEPLAVGVACSLLGLDEESAQALTAFSRTIFSSASREEKRSAVAAIQSFFERMLAFRVTHLGDDVFSLLVRAHVEDGILNTDEVVSMGAMMLVAGHETTANLISNSAAAMALDQDLQNRLRSDPGLTVGWIESSLKHDSPVSVCTTRFATSDVSLGDTSIPKGSIILVALSAANGDPSSDGPPQADSALATQSRPTHLSFGYGRHGCLGAQLARLEGRIAVSCLLTKAASFRMSDRSPLRWRQSMTMHGLEELKIVFEG